MYPWPGFLAKRQAKGWMLWRSQGERHESSGYSSQDFRVLFPLAAFLLRDVFQNIADVDFEEIAKAGKHFKTDALAFPFS